MLLENVMNKSFQLLYYNVCSDENSEKYRSFSKLSDLEEVVKDCLSWSNRKNIFLKYLNDKNCNDFNEFVNHPLMNISYKIFTFFKMLATSDI